MSSYRLVASVCKDGDCPSVLIDDETGDHILRGPIDGEDHEVDIRWTAQQWAQLTGRR